MPVHQALDELDHGLIAASLGTLEQQLTNVAFLMEHNAPLLGSDAHQLDSIVGFLGGYFLIALLNDAERFLETVAPDNLPLAEEGFGEHDEQRAEALV